MVIDIRDYITKIGNRRVSADYPGWSNPTSFTFVAHTGFASYKHLVFPSVLLLQQMHWSLLIHLGNGAFWEGADVNVED